jgi:hypothetical protein
MKTDAMKYITCVPIHEAWIVRLPGQPSKFFGWNRHGGKEVARLAAVKWKSEQTSTGSEKSQTAKMKYIYRREAQKAWRVRYNGKQKDFYDTTCGGKETARLKAVAYLGEQMRLSVPVPGPASRPAPTTALPQTKDAVIQNEIQMYYDRVSMPLLTGAGIDIEDPADREAVIALAGQYVREHTRLVKV